MKDEFSLNEYFFEIVKSSIHYSSNPQLEKVVDTLFDTWNNDQGWGSVFSGQLEPWLTKNDVLVGFSVHGGSGADEAGPWSQNLAQAMKLAKERKSKIIGF